MASVHDGHRGRVKTEFLARGVEGWSDHRVLELLLFYALPRGDVNAISHALIGRFGSFAGVLDASADELMQVPGVGEHAAVLLKMIPNLCGRYVAQRSERGQVIENERDAIRELFPYFTGARNEMVYALCMDGKGKLLGVRKLSEGCIDAAEINIRRLMEEIMALRAVRVCLAHNHISSLALPSRADWVATDRLQMLLESVGVLLVDHIIFVDDDAVSLAASGQFGRRALYTVT